MDPSFGDSRECKLLSDIAAACEEQDVDAFTNAVYEFDSVQKLDSGLTTMLLGVKNNLKAGPDIL
jgi:alpha-soluble NSF attachment protein